MMVEISWLVKKLWSFFKFFLGCCLVYFLTAIVMAIWGVIKLCFMFILTKLDNLVGWLIQIISFVASRTADPGITPDWQTKEIHGRLLACYTYLQKESWTLDQFHGCLTDIIQHYSLGNMENEVTVDNAELNRTVLKLNHFIRQDLMFIHDQGRTIFINPYREEEKGARLTEQYCHSVKTLELSSNATCNETKTQFRALSKLSHPDKIGKPESAMFRVISKAREHLIKVLCKKPNSTPSSFDAKYGKAKSCEGYNLLEGK